MENSVVENPYSHQFEQTFIQKRLITADNFTNILVTIVGNIRKIHDPIWMCFYVCVYLCACALVKRSTGNCQPSQFVAIYDEAYYVAAVATLVSHISLPIFDLLYNRYVILRNFVS